MNNPTAREYIELNNLSAYAKAYASSIEKSGEKPGKCVVRRVLRDLRTIDNTRRRATVSAAKSVSVPQEYEWLLDNWYIAEREGKSASLDFKSASVLPCTGSAQNRLFVLDTAQALVESGLCDVTEERLYTYLDAFQIVTTLTESELSVFIPALKIELIAVLAEKCRTLDTDSMTADTELAALFGRVFTSLRFLSGFDARALLESVNRLEQILASDPAGVYPLMEDAARISYRRELTRLARLNDISEHDAARYAVELSQPDTHVGHFIFAKPLGSSKKQRTGGLYIGFVSLASLFLSLLIGFMLNAPAIALLLLLPVSEFVKTFTDYFIIHLSGIKRVERLELSGGIPDSGKTLCAVSVLLSGQGTGGITRLLEEYRLSNRDAGSENLLFALLADLPEAKTAETQNDTPFIEAASREIEALNEKYGGGFFLLYRKRVKNERDGFYSGWERKRGAILELCRYLRREKSGIICASGDGTMLTDGIKYIIALDTDTRLTAGSARKLVGAAMHPLNRPVIDLKHKTVVGGHGIIQPRVSVSLSSFSSTDFTLFFTGQGGIDPYGGAASDLYQNMLGLGSFCGKGIIDVDAYLTCLGSRFPEQKVLSHDLLEGAFLRCAFAGDIELVDGFPTNARSYYSRMHRWVRGDWQTIPWLARYAENAEGKRIINPLPQIDKWKIIDNLRRSLTAPALLAAILTGFLCKGYVFTAVLCTAIAIILTDLIIAGASSVFKGYTGRVRYVSKIISGFGAQIIRSFIKLMLLPYEAWVCFHAFCTAVFRMTISKKRLLEWTTAAESERRVTNGFLAYFTRMLPCVITAVIVFLFSPYPPALAAAIVWLLTPAYAYTLGKAKKPRREISGENRLFLSRCAGDAWRYFEDMLTPEDNYLPPDNFQEQPSVGIAHRTSPTNIGLALISALAAADLGACKWETALGLIENMLASIERLPKWRGHLYNWYDTTTMSVLNPAYVSTVDSGNFAACLVALRSGLVEHGETALAEKITYMLSQMSFQPLYDQKRQLFYIGYDLTKNTPSDSWYDLLASEAMLTSYYAIASGDVPRKHWRRLSRSLVGLDGYRGMASWTGTMFEYLMPGLLLPCYRDSLIYESLKFCIRAQKAQTRKKRPWGMSESAFYDFDHTLSYRYKAHGVQKLALKRGMAQDEVISPYSSFLALTVDLRASIVNLRRLQKLGAEGRYGFYEAIDYTPVRVRSREFELVKTYMAHHIGMSLVSIDNTLNGGIMQKRFMRDCEMSAFAELLQEKVPVGGIVLSGAPREVPEKPRRASSATWRFETDNIDAALPRCCLIGNGSYVVTMAETGQSRSVWNGVTMTRSSFDSYSRETGISFFLWSGGEFLSLMPSPAFDENTRYTAEMSGGVCRITSKSGTISSAVSVTVPEKDAGELRTVEITSQIHRDAELICCFEPVLSRSSDYNSHPAFSKMSLETSELNGSVIIRRRPRVKGSGLVLAFLCDRVFSFDTSRETAYGRGGISALKTALTRIASGTTGAVLDPCVLARVKLRLEANTPLRVKFALAPSYSELDAFEAGTRILTAGDSAASSRVENVSERLCMSTEQTDTAMSLVSEIVYTSPYRRVPEHLLGSLALGQRGLWSLGISGDYPIVSMLVEAVDNLPAVLEITKTHTLLTECGAVFDLAFILRDGGDYRGALKSGITDILRANNLTGKLGARGGIHTVNAESDSAATLQAVSVCVLQPGESLPASVNRREKLPLPDPPEFYAHALSGTPSYSYNSDNSFTFSADKALPLNAWSHMLTNGGYGYIASDAGCGHMWYQNARENKINRWLNDSLETEGTERLHFLYGGKRVSLFASPDGYECRVTYGFGFARWEKTIDGINTSVTAYVPPDTDCRVFIIETDAPENAEIHYYTDLIIGADDADAVYVTTERVKGAIAAKNTYSAGFDDTVFSHVSSAPEKLYTCHKQEYRSGIFAGVTGTGFTPCIAAVYRAKKALVLVSGCAPLEIMQKLASPDTAGKKLEETLGHWRKITGRFTVKTPCENLNRYLNGWAIYQTYACRVLGRSSLYQSGGAYGYRDQLQDVCALTGAVPDAVKKQIILAAEHQYEEGDVQHWWHPGTADGTYGDRGVRTKCSDDLLWLAYTLCEYTEKTGDDSLCGVNVPYLRSQPLHEDEHERYEQPHKSDMTEPVIKHAARALDLVLSRGTGRHGLCLIGGGDWNDGMNLVGAGGEGESVWLTWFVIHTAERFASLCKHQGNASAAERYRAAVVPLRKAAENAWDGGWYLRGYFDDGTPLGSAMSDECRIDSIAQSFAALGGGDGERVKTALQNAVDILFRRDERVIMLFDPPFSSGRVSPGYIKGYSPGFRENGGQYTHGAIWLAMSLLLTDMTDLGYELLEALLPQGRRDDLYRTEPYVLAADVYSNENHLGRGGWTWYTGASGWFLRVAMENLLGLREIGGVLHITPKLPSSWNGYEVTWNNGVSEYRITVGADSRVTILRDGSDVTHDPMIDIGGVEVNI